MQVYANDDDTTTTMMMMMMVTMKTMEILVN